MYIGSSTYIPEQTVEDCWPEGKPTEDCHSKVDLGGNELVACGIGRTEDLRT